MHGFALNCDCDLSWFDRIVPCGIRDATVTSLSAELDKPVSVDDVLPIVERHLPSCCSSSQHKPAKPDQPTEHYVDRRATRTERRDRCTAGRSQAAPPRGAQRPDAHREEAGLDQDPPAHGTGVHRAQVPCPPRGTAHRVREAGCPNIYECWEDREATFLIGGDQCTRRCDFCRSTPASRPRSTSTSRGGSPSRCKMGLRYATVTGVARGRPGRRRCLALCRDGSVIHAQPGHRCGAAHSPFNAKLVLLDEVFAVAQVLAAQHRDRSAHLQADPARLPLRPLDGCDPAGAVGRSGDEVQPHSRDGRGAA